METMLERFIASRVLLSTPLNRLGLLFLEAFHTFRYFLCTVVGTEGLSLCVKLPIFRFSSCDRSHSQLSNAKGSRVTVSTDSSSARLDCPQALGAFHTGEPGTFSHMINCAWAGTSLPFVGVSDLLLSLLYRRAPKASYKMSRFAAFLHCLRTAAVLVHTKNLPFYPMRQAREKAHS